MLLAKCLVVEPLRGILTGVVFISFLTVDDLGRQGFFIETNDQHACCLERLRSPNVLGVADWRTINPQNSYR